MRCGKGADKRGPLGSGARARADERERLQAERCGRAGPGSLLGWSRGAGVWAGRESGIWPGERDRPREREGEEEMAGWLLG